MYYYKFALIFTRKPFFGSHNCEKYTFFAKIILNLHHMHFGCLNLMFYCLSYQSCSPTSRNCLQKQRKTFLTKQQLHFNHLEYILHKSFLAFSSFAHFFANKRILFNTFTIFQRINRRLRLLVNLQNKCQIDERQIMLYNDSILKMSILRIHYYS